MIELFPELPFVHAKEIAVSLQEEEIATLRGVSALKHDRVRFRETGGHRVSDDRLKEISARIREIAEEEGYPDRLRGSMVAFDAEVGRFLHSVIEMAPNQGAREEVWSFFGCVLLPDVVRWRWGGDSTPWSRFAGVDRGLRHTFGRCWWRAEVLRDDADERDPYHLLSELGEDEVVGFVERSASVTSRRVAVAVAKEILRVHASGVGIARVTLARDVMKRFLRVGAVVSYEAQSDAELQSLVAELLQSSVAALRD